MKERLPPDHAEREAIRNDLDVTMLVEAAAGTGKTTNLVKRMVNVVKTERATPATMAAITFTVKAAAHLREEFERHPEPRRRRRISSAEILPLRCAQGQDDVGVSGGFIGTTHAFCAQLLRERPVEAGLDPEFEELDAPAATQLASYFWNRWFDAKAVSGDPLVEEARDAGLDRATLRGAFMRLVDHPDIVLVSERRPAPDFRDAVRQLVAFLDRCEPHMPNLEDADKFERLMRRLLRLRRSLDLAEPFSQFVILDEANHASDLPTQKRWGKAIAKELGPAYEALVLGTIRPVLRQWREHVHGIAIDLLRPAAEEFAAARRRNGTLTFGDLLVCARDMLRDHPNVRRYFQRRFTHVFVDEFQDTDPVQAEVLMYLTGEEVEEKNWRKLHPRPGSLFIVGDPKQSIYRFRRADITTYLDVRKQIEESGGRIVRLWTNFRSLPEICTFVNESFPHLFKKDDVDARRQAEHVDLESFRPNVILSAAKDLVDEMLPLRSAQGQHDVKGVFALETPDGRHEEMACAEAEVVGKWIRGDVAKGRLKWGDVLLVSWQTPRLSCYARVFEQLGVPYEITGSKAFKELQALADAMPLLRAVATPEDQVSIVAFLRGPLCGADDDALYRFRKAEGRFSPFAEAPEGTDKRIVRGLAIIREGIEDAKRHPPAAAIARLFDRIGLIALSAAGERPGTRSGNLLLALSIARDLSERGETLASIVEQLDELLENPPDIEELDVDPARENAVRLMNLHQVKGLEAPVVFLVDPVDGYDFPVDLIVDRSGEQSRGHFAVTKEWGRAKKHIGVPVGWEQLESVEKEFHRAEKMRQLYVAATRAQNMLVVGFRMWKGDFRGAWSELAKRVKERFKPDSEEITAAESHEAIERQFADAVDDITRKFESARGASYSVLPVTKVAHASHLDLVKAEEGLGKGTSWGRVLHRLFEAMLRDERLDIRLYAANLLKDEERDPVELDEVMKVVDSVRSSALWSRVKSAEERYGEIPFALTVPRREVGLDEDGDTLLHGTIDLVFRERDRWFIVDYKSDSTAGRIDVLVEYYKPQVEHYARFWSQLTGAPASAGLFFVDGAIEKWV